MKQHNWIGGKSFKKLVTQRKQAVLIMECKTLQTSKQLRIKVLQKLRIVQCQHIAGKCSYYLTNLNYGSTDSDYCRTKVRGALLHDSDPES
ncbi:hypothetical protein TSUD_70190 [Trifolium subterraneum]|uniref:Uncharacterized protein n=1 Tax=Trifolium subterraneum TaxID=3900 RepID=A0A2Z6M0X0_TRISU|nr:hypothetical protein TSUD_70190 [Trifolium subterraneum]